VFACPENRMYNLKENECGAHGGYRNGGASMGGCSWVKLVDYLLKSGNITWCGLVMYNLVELCVEMWKLLAKLVSK
jgi:hypothetical protein